MYNDVHMQCLCILCIFWEIKHLNLNLKASSISNSDTDSELSMPNLASVSEMLHCDRMDVIRADSEFWTSDEKNRISV